MIISNKAQCLSCMDVVESQFRHDFQQCSCGDIFVDGGQEYLRRGGDLSKLKELSEFTKEEYDIG